MFLRNLPNYLFSVRRAVQHRDSTVAELSQVGSRPLAAEECGTYPADLGQFGDKIFRFAEVIRRGNPH